MITLECLVIVSPLGPKYFGVEKFIDTFDSPRVTLLGAKKKNYVSRPENVERLGIEYNYI